MVSPTENEEARLNYNQGTEYLDDNKLEEAEKCLLKAIELDPNFCDAMDHLGLVYRRQERYEEAIEIYLRSISINSKNSVSYQNLAVVYRIQQKYEDARQQYIKMIELDENNPEPYYGIGQLYFDVEMFENCIDIMQIALQKYIDENSVYSYDAGLYIGYAYYNLENYEEALKYLKFTASYYDTDENLLSLISELEKSVNTKDNGLL